MASTSNHTLGIPSVNPAVAGTACCIASAVAYTGANICLRQLAGEGVSVVMTICVKETVAIAVVGPWLVWRWLAGDRIIPSAATMSLLIGVGLAVQLIGNLGQQFAFGVVGLAVTVPVIYGILLVGAAVLGRVVLRERISPRTTIAMVFLLLSIAILAAGTAQGTTVQVGAPWWLTAAAVGAALLAGITFALLTVTVRGTVTRGVSQMLVVFTITGVGAVSLAVLSLRGDGLEAWRTLPGEHWAWMLASGVLNLIGFVALTKGLHLASVVNVNLLNASQVAMAACAGIVLFHEQVTPWLIVGVGMTVVGMILIDRRLPTVEA